MSVYTRTGDKGKTSLYQGKRVSKASPRVEAYGSVDELNSAIGVALAQVSSIKYQVLSIKKELIKIQNDLFDIGANLANPGFPRSGIPLRGTKNLKLDERVQEFENIIDELENNLPPLANFILPGGGRAGSYLHLARTIARRAERRIVALSEKEGVDSSIVIYINRLSDLLFMMARFINFKEKKKEIVWSKR